MIKLNSLLIAGLLSLFILVSCKEEETKTKDLSLTTSRLGNLGANYVYQGWLINGTDTTSVGTFTASERFPKSFPVNADKLSAAKSFMVTVEQKSPTATKPSNTRILSGTFSDFRATLSVNSAIGNFANAAGKYVLGTPTNGANAQTGTDSSKPLSGVAWLIPNPKNPTRPSPGLTGLPSLPQGWIYEGWAVIKNTTTEVPVSTGTFRNPNNPDNSNKYGETPNIQAGRFPHLFPGEDFLKNAPAGLNFPLGPPPATPTASTLIGGQVVISVEPVPDNDPAKPFFLKPLTGTVALPTQQTPVQSMQNQERTLPTGQVVR